MNVEQRRYRAYLLRLWQEQRNTQLVWRFSLEDAHTNERHGFAEVELLFGFLRQLIKIEDNEETLAD